MYNNYLYASLRYTIFTIRKHSIMSFTDAHNYITGLAHYKKLSCCSTISKTTFIKANHIKNTFLMAQSCQPIYINELYTTVIL